MKWLAMSLLHLPLEVISHIMSFMSWKEKKKVGDNILQLQQSLQSPRAWERFIFVQTLDTDLEEGAISLSNFSLASNCLETYGKYIQHCGLWFPAYFIGSQFIEALVKHCRNMKTMSVQCQDANPDVFEMLFYLAWKCPSLTSINQLGVKYTAVDRLLGITEVFDPIVSHGNEKLMDLVKVFAFTQVKTFVGPVHHLANFTSLTKLKCQIQCVNTTILLLLFDRSLAELHVVNDDTTSDVDFKESEAINWSLLAEKYPRVKVAYTICFRTISADNLVANPLLSILVLDSLCCGVRPNFLLAIARLYSSKLRVFVHTNTRWESRPYDGFDSEIRDAYFSLIKSCIHLETVAITVKLPPITVLHISFASHLKAVAGGQGLKNLWVNRRHLTNGTYPELTILSSDDPVFLRCDHLAPHINMDEQGCICSSVRDYAGLERAISCCLQSEWRALYTGDLMERLRSLTDPCDLSKLWSHTLNCNMFNLLLTHNVRSTTKCVELYKLLVNFVYSKHLS